MAEQYNTANVTHDRDHGLQVRAMDVQEKPEDFPVQSFEDGYQVTVISTATTTPVKASPGYTKGFRILANLAGTLTINDGTGQVIVFPIGTTADWYPFPKKFSTDIEFITSAADDLYVVSR